MANEEQLTILKQGVKVWNQWRKENPHEKIDLSYASLNDTKLLHANLSQANLRLVDFTGATLIGVNFSEADLSNAELFDTDFSWAVLSRTRFTETHLANTIIGSNDLSEVIDIEKAYHNSSSIIGNETFYKSKGQIPEVFLRGCGLSDWEIESIKLYKPDLSNEEINKTLYKIYDLRATQALQISPLFISYSHDDDNFVDKVENHLNKKGVRFWRDIHDMKSGRMEKQIDRAMRLNPTVLLILSEHSLQSDWVEHEVRTARALEKEMKRDVLCPIALDDSWKSSPWAKRIMEQVMEYNILDFSKWKDDDKFGNIFNKLIDGLELFYK